MGRSAIDVRVLADRVLDRLLRDVLVQPPLPGVAALDLRAHRGAPLGRVELEVRRRRVAQPRRISRQPFVLVRAIVVVHLDRRRLRSVVAGLEVATELFADIIIANSPNIW